MRVCLFGLTGFGNAILERILMIPSIEDVLVYTRHEKGRFPYYECEHLFDLCKKRGIKPVLDRKVDAQSVYRELINFRPDMILVATFDQKLPKRIIDIPKMDTINIHPSLLPDYRGPTPTHWSIINGEYESGVTYHFLIEEFDMGDILYQKRIRTYGLSDGQLRRELANLSGSMLETFLEKYIHGEIKPKPQKRDEGSCYPKVTSEKGIALLRTGHFDMENLVLGLTPYPGIEILG